MNYPLYNETLCPKLWNINEDGPKLDSEVRNSLLKIATDFVKDLKQSNNISIEIEDVVMIGSLTNYNWTQYSDIDLHIVTDYTKLDFSKEDAQTLFDAIKTAWNSKHDIKMKGHDVEIYVQDTEHEAVSASEYSVLNDRWIKEPIKEKPNFNKKLIKKKYSEYKKKIDSLVKQKDDVGLKDMLDKLYKFRQSGLDSKGELSEENIVFKILRAKGHLDKLKDSISKIYDKKVSVKEVERIDDGLDSRPNGTLIRTPDDEESDLVLVDDDKTKRVHRFHGIKIFGAYEISLDVAKELRSDADPEDLKNDMKMFRKAIKHPKNEESSKIVSDLVDLSVDRMFTQMNMEGVTVIAPCGSSSKLNEMIANKIKERLPNASILDGLVKKSTWKDVRLSPTWQREIDQEKIDGIPREGPRQAKAELEAKQRNHPDETFQVQQTRRGLRRYYSMFYHTDEGKVVEAEKLLKNAKVLVIDDTMEEGATMTEALRLINGYEPREVIGYVFLWGRSAQL